MKSANKDKTLVVPVSQVLKANISFIFAAVCL